MRIEASPLTRAAVARPTLPKPDQDPPAPDKVVYNHLPAQRFRVHSRVGAVLGAGAAVGINALAQGNLWTGLAAAGLGAFLGANYSKFLYSGQAKAREIGNITAQHSKPEEPSFEPLKKADLLAERGVGRSPRLYDGYDSSRDIAALYAREGRPEQAYAVEVEVAHLRPAAELGHLDTRLELSWGPQQSYQVNLDQDNDSTRHSTTFNRIQKRIDKDELRQLGWKDGQPMTIRAVTSDEKTEQASLQGRTDNPQQPGNIFRWEGKTVYYAVTDRFNNGDRSNDQGTDPANPQKFHGGDWQGVIEKLDYLKGLNVDCIWLSCPYEAQRDFLGMDGFHGYWPMDFKQAEPGFGSREKLHELVEKAHAKGMKIMLDVVLNHTGYGHPFTTAADKKDWFNANGNISGLGQWEMENGSLCGLPDLRQQNPEVSKYLVEVHKDWLKEADGFRIDAMRHMPEDFLRHFNQEMKKEKPDFYGVGEAFWLKPNFVAGYQNRTSDSMFDFPLAYAIRRTFAGDPSRTLHDRIEYWKEVKPHASQHEAWRVLLDSHKSQDMSLLSEALSHDKLYDNPLKLGTFIDNHDMVRFMSDTAGDIRRQEQALAFLYAVRGTPHVYYGTEVAMEGIGPANRNDMEWGKNPELTEKFRRLSEARRGSEALQFGSQEELHCDQDTYAFSRIRPEEEVVCLFNKGDEPETVTVNLHRDSPIPDGAVLKDMFGAGTATVQEHSVTVTIPAKGYTYLQWK
ncbi:MAG: alpha-amylase family glycosyl hydrolase [Vulcanimicrobiota bacterium]